MVTLDKATYTRFVAKAKAEGVKVSGNVKAGTFRVSSASGNGEYAVTVSNYRMGQGTCTCPAGAHDKACKHLAASLAAMNYSRVNALVKG